MPYMTTDILFYAFLSPDNGGTEGGAKTIESTTELFYAEHSEAILKMGCELF